MSPGTPRTGCAPPSCMSGCSHTSRTWRQAPCGGTTPRSPTSSCGTGPRPLSWAGRPRPGPRAARATRRTGTSASRPRSNGTGRRHGTRGAASASNSRTARGRSTAASGTPACASTPAASARSSGSSGCARPAAGSSTCPSRADGATARSSSTTANRRASGSSRARRTPSSRNSCSSRRPNCPPWRSRWPRARPPTWRHSSGCSPTTASAPNRRAASACCAPAAARAPTSRSAASTPAPSRSPRGPREGGPAPAGAVGGGSGDRTELEQAGGRRLGPRQARSPGRDARHAFSPHWPKAQLHPVRERPAGTPRAGAGRRSSAGRRHVPGC